MALAAHATDTAGHRVPQRLTAAWYGLAVLVVATIFAAIDRQILLLVTEPLKHALALSDSQIGALNGIALSLVAALAVFPMGWLADRVDRRTLLWVCVLVWSLATGACGLAQTFPQLFVCGMGIAVGEAILGPITYSIIPDLFPQDRWIIANYVFFLAGVVGGALGLSLSGGTIGLIEAHHAALPPLVAHLATWRVALLAVALPGPVIAVLIALIRTRPRIVSEAAERGSGLLAYFREHLRTLVGVFVGFGFAASAWGTIQTWMPVALVRVFGQTPAQTGVRLGITAAVASLIGVLASGLLVRKLRGRFGDHTPMRVAQFGIAVAALLLSLIHI